MCEAKVDGGRRCPGCQAAGRRERRALARAARLPRQAVQDRPPAFQDDWLPPGGPGDPTAASRETAIWIAGRPAPRASWR